MFNGGNNEFDLIVVLFILLVIVGVGYSRNGGY